MDGIVLSGGGSKGSWQVGVLQYLASSCRYPEGFQMVAGTSVGAINACAIAASPPDERQLHLSSYLMSRAWRGIRATSDIWRHRIPPIISGAFTPSIGRTEPLRKLLSKTINLKSILGSGVKLRIAATDLLSGSQRIFTEKDDIVRSVMASAAFPMIFPPEIMGNSYFSDGAIRELAPILSIF